MIANAGAMGLDWRTLDLSSYMEALEAYNEMHDPEAAAAVKIQPTERLARFMKAHTGQ